MEYTEKEKKAITILDEFELRRKTVNYNRITVEDSQCAKTVLNLLEKQQRKIQDLEDRNSKCSNISNNTEQSNPNKDIFTKEEIESLKSLVKSIKEKERAMQDILLFYERNKGFSSRNTI